MTDDLRCLSLTRRHLLLGATAIAANALAAACGSNVPVTPAATAIPASGTRVAPIVSTTTQPTVAVAPLPTPATIAVPPVAETFAPPTGSPTTSLIVFAGGSVVYGSGVQRTETFPAQTVALLAAAKYDAVNLGVVNQPISKLITEAPRTIDPLYAASRSKNIVVVYAGPADLYYGASVAETFARLVTFGQARRRVGFKVVMLTFLPALASWMRPGEDYETERQSVNALMRKNVASFTDALADVGADSTIGAVDSPANLDYSRSNGGLLTGKGYSIVARYVKAAILTL